MTNPTIRPRSPAPAPAPLAGILAAALALALGSGALIVVACGRTADLATSDAGADGATGGPSSGDALAPSFDGSITPPLVDADISQPDAGVPPVVACAEGGIACPAPPSDCLDDHTMRYFSGGMCNDGGTCDYTIITMKCDPAPMPPDCYQGGCRVVIVR